MSEDLFRVSEHKDRRFRLKRSKRKEWVEESFMTPDISDEQAVQYAKTDGYIGTVFTPKRFVFAFAFILIVLGTLFSRSMQLQVVQGKTYQEKANQNRLRQDPIRADRGLVYDRYLNPLVKNVPDYRVLIQANALPQDDRERAHLLEWLYQTYLITYLDTTLEEFFSEIEGLRQDVARRDKPAIIASQLRHDDAVALQIQAKDLDGVNIELVSRRHYLNEGPTNVDAGDTTVYPPVKSVSHLLGYLSSIKEGEYEEIKDNGYLYNDVLGRTGLEYSYEPILRGTFGKQFYEVNAAGKLKQVLAKEDAIDGLSIKTSIDLELQRASEAILQRWLDEQEKKRGSVVIIDPATGEILTMISLPTFDNNDFSKGISQSLFTELIEDENRPLFHRAISGEYPSGSTFKPIVAAAALRDGLITQNTTFLSVGGIRINQWFFPDWRAGGHGRTNVYHALGDSVNTFFYIIGGGYQDITGLGVARITEYAKEYGLASPLQIDLPGERSGFLPSKEWKETTKQERWYIGDTYHLAIGQGDLLVTPLQVASFISVFANGGTLYQPHIATHYLNKHGEIVKTIEPKVLNDQILDQKTASIIQTGLRRVVNIGSGKRLSDLPFEASGKTGTAQWHSTKDPHAWFAGYAPSEHPQLAFSVLVEEGEEGSSIAAGIARDILQWWYDHRASQSL